MLELLNPRSMLLLLALLPCCAGAQEQAIQRALIERDQQSDAFMLQLRQSQGRLGEPPARLQALDARHFAERQRFEDASDRQLRDVRPETPAELRPYERERAQAERRSIVTQP